MSEAGQAPGQERDEAGRDDRLRPWGPRTDGKRALLVSPRTTVFDHVVVPMLIEEPTEGADPIWDSRAGTVWTPDLVHCRLLLMAETINRLPEVLRSRYRSQIGKIVIAGEASERRSPPGPAAISLADWTWERLLELPERTRQMMVARAWGFSYDKIVDRLGSAGQRRVKSTVIEWDRDARRFLAADWQGRKHGIDVATYERWGELFARRQK